MSKAPVFLILLFLASAVPAALAPRTDPQTLPDSRKAGPLLRDGFILAGVDGTLIGPDSNDVWLFELASNVDDSSSVVKAGTRLELLPSSALEKMIADVKTHSTVTFRLWDGRVTRYKGRNFIFPNYFQPLRRPALSAAEGTQDARQKTEDRPQTSNLGKSDLAVDEPNDVLTLPPELLEKLRARREEGVSRYSTRIENQESSIEKSTDTIFADRTAFLVELDNDRLVMAPDALGRNIQKLTLRLLPCEVLELTEREQSAEPEPIRFKIVGIQTKYKGESYLLLHRATRAYSHSNFGR